MIASLYFGKHNTLLTILERTSNGYNLQYIKKISHILDLNSLESDSSSTAINEIIKILFQFSITDFFATLNPTYYISNHIPGNLQNSNKDEFMKLVNLSIKQHFSDKSIDDFIFKSILINSNNQMEFVSMISKDIIIAVKSVIAMFGYELTDINPMHIANINSFNFNYPEKINKTSILVHFLENVFVFIIMSNNKILGIEYCSVEHTALISNTIDSKLKQIIKYYNIIDTDCIYFYGNTLTKKKYVKCWEISMIITNDSKRLNPFRLINTNLEQRDIDYCARMFQMYVACIGGALPTQIATTIF